MQTLYRPIACALHDEFEIAVMRKKSISIQWRDEKGGINQGVVLAKDLLVKNKEEFLLVVTPDKNEL